MPDELAERAGKLADEFRERAAAYDRENRFPFENFDTLRGSGCLALTVPREFSGGGYGLHDLCRFNQILAGACGATALALNMHLHTIGVAASIWRRTGDDRIGGLFRAVVEQNLILAACASEEGTKGSLIDSRCRAVETPDGYVITGRKIICSLSPVMDLVSANAMLEGDGGRELIQFVAPRDAPGLVIRETWDALGMRATGSHELQFKDVIVPAGMVIASRKPGVYDEYVQEAIRWFAISLSAVYLGIARAAADLALGAAGPDLDVGERQLRLREIGRICVELAACQALLEKCAREIDGAADEMTAELFKRALEVKVFTTNAAQRVVDASMELMGGLGYLKRCPVERHYRDVRAGTIHPPNNRDALRIIAEIGTGTWQAGA